MAEVTSAIADISKANNRLLGERARHVETRARSLQTVVQRWLLRQAEELMREEMKRAKKITKRLYVALWDVQRIFPLTKIAIRKAPSTNPEQQLANILRAFGLRQMVQSAEGVVGTAPMMDAQSVQDALADKEVLVQGISQESRKRIKGIIAEGLRRGDSVGQIARRIRQVIASPERAARIARTELVQAENSGIIAGYEMTGVQEIEWLAYTDDRSLDRHHERMNGVRIKVGEEFTTPLGEKGGYTMRFPGDPKAPIQDTANCRCTIAPVKHKT